MARFLLDHNVADRTSLELRHLGHNVVTTRELHQERAPDYALILTAAEDGRILVTHNEKDFRLLHGAWHLWSGRWQPDRQVAHSGILIIPQWRPSLPEWTPEGAALQIDEFLKTHPQLINVLYAWRRQAGWTVQSPT